MPVTPVRLLISDGFFAYRPDFPFSCPRPPFGLNRHTESAASPVKLPQPLSASGSLRLFA
jgi:hypothetical protein